MKCKCGSDGSDGRVLIAVVTGLMRCHKCLADEREALVAACREAFQRFKDDRDPETLLVWNPNGDVEEALAAAVADAEKESTT